MVLFSPQMQCTGKNFFFRYLKFTQLFNFFNLNFFREYIRQKNIAADQHSPVDQCSGSSSGYYSSSREQEELRREQEELRREQEELRREQELKQEYFHRRERSVGSTRGEYRREELRQEREGRSAPPLADDMRGGRSQNYTPSTTSSFHSNGY